MHDGRGPEIPDAISTSGPSPAALLLWLPGHAGDEPQAGGIGALLVCVGFALMPLGATAAFAAPAAGTWGSTVISGPRSCGSGWEAWDCRSWPGPWRSGGPSGAPGW